MTFLVRLLKAVESLVTLLDKHQAMLGLVHPEVEVGDVPRQAIPGAGGGALKNVGERAAQSFDISVVRLSHGSANEAYPPYGGPV